MIPNTIRWGDGVRQRYRVTDIGLIAGQGLLSLQQVEVEGNAFMSSVYSLSFSFLSCPSLSSPLLSPISLLPFSGRRHKMTNKG